MEIKYSGSVYYDLDSMMCSFDNTMSDDEIREILYSDICGYDDFEYAILSDEINQIVAEVRLRIGEQLKF
jgi:hypothetical protein